VLLNRAYFYAVLLEQGGGYPVSVYQRVVEIPVVNFTAAAGRAVGFQYGFMAVVFFTYLQYLVGASGERFRYIGSVFCEDSPHADFSLGPRRSQAAELFGAYHDGPAFLYKLYNRYIFLVGGVIIAINSRQTRADYDHDCTFFFDYTTKEKKIKRIGEQGQCPWALELILKSKVLLMILLRLKKSYY